MSEGQDTQELSKYGKDFKIPEYDGIQTSLNRQPPSAPHANNLGHSPDPKLNISQGDSTRKLALGTSGTNHSLGTINLDALLQRQDNRLERIDKYAQDFDKGAIDSKLLAGLDESRYNVNPDMQSGRTGQQVAGGQNGQPKDELRELDTLLFDILKN